MSDPNITKSDLVQSIRESLGLPPRKEGDSPVIVNESYSTQAKKFKLSTELLSSKNKKSHQDLFEKYVDELNEISAKLDTAPRDDADPRFSEFRSLKVDETHNLNGTFLHGMFFENISDVHSQVTMDSMAFMRLERDFGSFDDWQKDFIACALSARNGWAVTVYNTFLNRYMNIVIDLHSQNIPMASYPVIVIDCWEHAYYRDYLNERKIYVFAMMKELNWDTIEERFKKAERISKATR
jgi:Fe-Mn family superoxide dismutase